MQYDLSANFGIAFKSDAFILSYMFIYTDIFVGHYMSWNEFNVYILLVHQLIGHTLFISFLSVPSDK